jgi:membrane protein implicated in regulation of membrane protease activity
MGVLNWIFLVSAILGGSIFLVRIILMIAGMGDHGADGIDSADAGSDVHADAHSDLHTDGHDTHHGETDKTTDSSFRMLSLQGIMAFFLMFGSLGFVLNRIAHTGPFWAVSGGLAAGILTMFLTAKLLSLLLKLQSDGTISIKNAIGQEGTVYLRIPAGGTGKIQIVVQNRLEELEAAAETEIPTGAKIKVTGIKSNILIVEKI